MLTRLALMGTVGLALAAAAPAYAVTINPGDTGLIFSPFVPGTQGTLLAFTSIPANALTYSATLRSAVYRNNGGTLDFYYQVARTGPGSGSNIPGGNDQSIDVFTASNFRDFSVTGFVSAADPDGGGAFTAANNPPSSTTTTGRSSDGQVLQTFFNANGLLGTDISATYIFRTNATLFQNGLFSTIDGSTLTVAAFAPAVPEPATWATMLLGFGAIGGAIRYRRRRTTLAYD